MSNQTRLEVLEKEVREQTDNLLLEIACGPAALASGEKGKETT